MVDFFFLNYLLMVPHNEPFNCNVVKIYFLYPLIQNVIKQEAEQMTNIFVLI